MAPRQKIQNITKFDMLRAISHFEISYERIKVQKRRGILSLSNKTLFNLT